MGLDPIVWPQCLLVLMIQSMAYCILYSVCTVGNVQRQ